MCKITDTQKTIIKFLVEREISSNKKHSKKDYLTFIKFKALNFEEQETRDFFYNLVKKYYPLDVEHPYKDHFKIYHLSLLLTQMGYDYKY